MSDEILAAVDVRKSYSRTPALNGVSLSVSQGELFGLLGPNGAGKTTLLSILAGLTNADAGRVTLLDEPFHTGRRDLRRIVGLATQDLAIYPELTARENLLFFGRLYGMHGADLRGRVEEMLAAVGLTDRGDHRAGTFSGGMKRRLNLAVAVVHRPRLLLLDEPTTGVDPQSRNHIFERVRALNSEGLTVIYTSHYMEEVQTLCPRIAVLDAGRVLACDTLPNLLRHLDAVARLTIPVCPAGLEGRLARLPGVKKVHGTVGGLDLTAAHLAPVLPAIISVCTEFGVTPAALDIDQPNLERVFLHLTGRGLRD